MAHFAEINENNEVIRVIRVDNNQIIDKETGKESEILGKQFCQQLFGGNWLQTSYNNNFRKRYAAIGYTYNQEYDAFLMPKPYPSWVFNEETLNWDPPIPQPTDIISNPEQKTPIWNEEKLGWDFVG